jgi:hypothetical protein
MTSGRDDVTRSHWSRWHDAYDDPRSSLSWRLARVRGRLAAALDDAAPGPVSVLSLCAGQGRDVIGVLARHPRRHDVRAVLLESDESNCADAARLAAELDVAGVEVRCADAALLSAALGGVPAQVLLLCGIFGNISDVDVEHTVRNCSRLCAPGATVLWTRHRNAPDLTVAIRRWFTDAGFVEVGFDVPDGDDSYAAVGTQRLAADPLPYQPDLRLFTFVDET